MRVVLIKGPSLYEGSRTFIDGIQAAFARRGFKADILDLVGLDDPLAAVLASALAGPTGLVFSINILGEARDGRGRTVAEIFGAPHVVWHVDYILSQDTRLEQTPAETALLVVDPTQVDAVRDIYGAERFRTVAFCPHAAVGEAAPDDADPVAFAADRPIGLLWSGSLQQTGRRPWADEPGGARQVFDEAYELALSQEWMPPHRAMDAVLAARGLELSNPKYVGARVSAKWIDIEVRKTRRFAFLDAVSRAGLPMHICGEGWESELHRFPQATYEGAVPMPRVVELMRSSRVVLNTNGNFGAGSHERPLSALLAGAAAFSDYTSFYDEALGAGEGVALFRWQDLDGAMTDLTALAGDPERAWRIAQVGKAKVAASHTFDHRLDLILRAVGLQAA